MEHSRSFQGLARADILAKKDGMEQVNQRERLFT